MAFNKILVPLDGTENSEATLGFVKGMATALGAEIVLLGVVDPRGATVGEGAADRIEARKVDDQVASAKSYLDSHVDQLTESSRSLKVSAHVATGKPADAIIEQAKELGADMIAMSTHRGTLVARGILGSVTDHVLRTSPVPVMAVRPDDIKSFAGNAGAPNVVIVPLDGSKLAEESVPAALEIAELCSSEIIFMRAVHLPSFAVSGPGADFYGNDFGVSGERKKAEEYLAKFVKQAEDKGIKAQAHATLGNAAARIIEEANNVDGAIVVISSHGRGGFRRMMLGSVADKIVRASHRPVLILQSNN